MNKYLQRFAVVLMLGVFMLGISGCNTMHGVGHDIEKVGEEIQEEAHEN